MIASWKLAAALAAGNSVVLNPAEDASLSTIRLVTLIEEAGFPAESCYGNTGLHRLFGCAISARQTLMLESCEQGRYGSMPGGRPILPCLGLA